MKLYENVAEYRAQLEALADLDLDDKTYRDTFESIGGELEAKLRAVIAFALELDIQADGAANAAKRMKERADALNRRCEWLKQYALDAMTVCGIKEIDADEFCAKIAKTPGRVVIAEGAELPIEYLRVKTVSEPDKTALKDALSAGAEIPGVSLVSGFRLAIR